MDMEPSNDDQNETSTMKDIDERSNFNLTEEKAEDISIVNDDVTIDDKSMEEEDERSTLKADNSVIEISNFDQEKVNDEEISTSSNDKECEPQIELTDNQLYNDEQTDISTCTSSNSDDTIQPFDLNHSEDLVDTSKTMSTDSVNEDTENPEESFEHDSKTDDGETRNELDCNIEPINEKNENSSDYGEEGRVTERIDQNVNIAEYNGGVKYELNVQNVNDCEEEKEIDTTSVSSANENCQLRNEIENDFDNIDNLLKAEESNNPNQEDKEIEDTKEIKEKISDDNSLPLHDETKESLGNENSEMEEALCDNNKQNLTGGISDLGHGNERGLKLDNEREEQSCFDEKEDNSNVVELKFELRLLESEKEALDQEGDNANVDGLKFELHRVVSEKEVLEKQMSHIKNQLDRLSRDFEASVARLIDVKQELIDLTTKAVDNPIVPNSDNRNEITKEIDIKTTTNKGNSDAQEEKTEDIVADLGIVQKDKIDVRIEINEENTISLSENEQTETKEANKNKANFKSDNEEEKSETKGVMKKLRGRIQGVFKGESFKRTKDRNNSEEASLNEEGRLSKGVERKKKKRKRTISITEPIIRKRRDSEKEQRKKQNNNKDQKKTKAVQENSLNVDSDINVERKESIVALVVNSTKVIGIGNAIDNEESTLPQNCVSASSDDNEIEEYSKVLLSDINLNEEQKDGCEESDSSKTKYIDTENNMTELIEPVIVVENLSNKEIDRNDNVEPVYSLIDEINRVLNGENNEENEMVSVPCKYAEDSDIIDEIIEAKNETFEEAFEFQFLETAPHMENGIRLELQLEVDNNINDLNVGQPTDVVDFVDKAYAEIEANNVLSLEGTLQSKEDNDFDTQLNSQQTDEEISKTEDEGNIPDKTKIFVEVLDINDSEKDQIAFDGDINFTANQITTESEDSSKNLELAENTKLHEYQPTPNSDTIEILKLEDKPDLSEKLELAESLCPSLAYSKTIDKEGSSEYDKSACEHIYAQIEVVDQTTNVNDVTSMKNDDDVSIKEDAVTSIKNDDIVEINDDNVASINEELEKVIGDEILCEIELSAIKDQLDEVYNKEKYLVEMNCNESDEKEVDVKTNEEEIEDLRKLKFEQEVIENKLKLTNEELEKYTDKNKELKNELNKTKDFLSDVIMKKQANERELIKVKQRLKKVVFIRQRFENEFEEVELDFQSIPVEEEDTFELLEEENEFLDNFLREGKGSSPKTQKEYRILKKRILEVVEQMIEDLEKLNQNLPPGNRFFGRRKESMRREIMGRLQSRLKDKLKSYVN